MHRKDIATTKKKHPRKKKDLAFKNWLSTFELQMKQVFKKNFRLVC
jgi:hypothetical protein